MAEDKKKIIVYADWITKFEALEDDEAGRLIKHFFRYINDLNPEYPDRITELSFIDIQNTLKRDLKKWENRADKSRENGKLGGRPPEKNNLKEPNKTKQVISEPKEPVNVSVNDSVIVNDNVLSKDNIKTKTKVLEFIELSNSEIESIKMKYGDEAYNFCIETLNNYKGSSGKKYKSDYHTICGWVMTKFNEFKKSNQNGTKHESPTEYAERMYKATLGYSPSEVRTED